MGWGRSTISKVFMSVNDSDKMDLVMPEDPLSKITNGKITKMRRPWEEKEARKDVKNTKKDA